MTRPRRSGGALPRAALALTLAAACPAVGAAQLTAPGAPREPGPAVGAVAHAAAETSWAPETIVVAEPGPVTARLAAEAGARSAETADGAYVVPTDRAGALSERLRRAGLLRFAEPDARPRRAAAATDPLGPAQWWTPLIGLPEAGPASPPAGTAAAGPPALGLIEGGVDALHPDLSGHVTMHGEDWGTPSHGTATASVAVAALNGVGLSGVWPGAHAGVWTAPAETCSTLSAAVVAAADAGAPVINMSYGFLPGDCRLHLIATQHAHGRGSLLVASAGNERLEGNPKERPANDPHILTVGSIGPDLAVSGFSNRSRAIDLVAPGERIPVAVPLGLDVDDGVQDGYELAGGTSFAAPIVSAAAAWLRAVRPRLDNDQIADALRRGARDLGARGRDAAYGDGLLNVQAALRARPSPRDPREPNEDIEWVDGTRFSRADAPLLARGRRSIMAASLRAVEDPVDVYPVRVAGRSRVMITVVPLHGNADVEVFQPGARSIARKRSRFLLATGRLPGRRRERITVLNSGRRAGVMHVAVSLGRRSGDRARYRLSVRSARYRPS